MLGGAIVRKLSQGGDDVRALVRNPDAEAAMRSAGVRPVFGDLKDPASLLTACEGVTTVISTANSAARGGDDNVVTVDRDGNLSLIDTAAQAGVEHFVFVSAQGADPASPQPFLQAKGIACRRLRESGMRYTILHPDVYMDVWIPIVILAPLGLGEPVTVVAGGKRKHHLVAVDDVAGFAVAAVGGTASRDLLIGGPEALSWSDVIAEFEKLHGRKLEVQSLPLGAPMPGFPPAVGGLMSALETYDSPPPLTSAQAEAEFGVRLTSVAEFLGRMADVS